MGNLVTVERGRMPLTRASMILGFGLGGFFDGIVLHQLLQWHHFVSSMVTVTTVPGLELNTLWDGIFHSAMYVVTAIGLILVWRAINRVGAPFSPRAAFGGILLGAGVFNLFDSIVNHWILGIHHIREVEDWLVYDIAFFIAGLILIGAGMWLIRRAQASLPARTA